MQLDENNVQCTSSDGMVDKWYPILRRGSMSKDDTEYWAHSVKKFFVRVACSKDGLKLFKPNS